MARRVSSQATVGVLGNDADRRARFRPVNDALLLSLRLQEIIESRTEVGFGRQACPLAKFRAIPMEEEDVRGGLETKLTLRRSRRRVGSVQIEEVDAP